MTEYTIAAVSTPDAAGGIAVIRISGNDALEIADRIFKPLSSDTVPSKMAGYTCAYGYVHNNGRKIDDAVLTVFRAPRSYTGEDVAEISCHGGIFGTRTVLRLAFDCGAVPAAPGEFTRRAFENGKMSLTQAEAVMDIIGADNRACLRRANNVRDGLLYKKAAEQRDKLKSVLAAVGAWIDYPDEDIEGITSDDLESILTEIGRDLQAIADRYDDSRIIRSGVETVIIGRPNTGKSTLMNLLSGSERSIVTDIAGTTRDVIEESVRIGDVVLKISDTAGIRSAADTIESIGIEMAKKRLANADLVLAVFDGSEPLSDDDLELLRLCGETDAKKIAIVNKSDKGLTADISPIRDAFEELVVISAANGERDELDGIVRRLFAGENPVGEIIINERQRRCLINATARINEACAAIHTTTLDAVDIVLDEALAFLLELTGEQVSEAVVDEIFSAFCVGK